MYIDQTQAGGLVPGIVALLGVPWDENSTFMRGSTLAPGQVRSILYSGESNLYTETGIDLGTDPRFCDLGDLELGSETVALGQIETAVAKLLVQGARVLCLGGDHAITYPVLRAYGRTYQELSILHLDAHPDLYDKFEDNRHSHACPFARIMEERLALRLVQVGIRSMTAHQRSQAARFGAVVHEMRNWHDGHHLDIGGPVYVSLDLDVLDPAFAPGVSHHEAGGLSTRDVIRLIQGVHGPIVGADIVELNPKRDPLGITAAAAAKLLKELVARMLEPASQGSTAK